MIILIPILLYILISVTLIWISNFLLKRKGETVRKRFKKWIIGTSIVFFFPLVFFYILHLFGLALDDHYDVKKGTLLWYATMDNETITNFPILEPDGKVKYNSIGGDSPSISTGWEIEYKSKTDNEKISKQIVEYLQNEGYDIQPVNETKFYWLGKNKKEEMNKLYSGSNKKGEGLDLLIQKHEDESTKIECSIIY